MAKIFETPTLETTRLILRPRTLEDSSTLQKYFNNWNIIKHLNDTVPWPYPETGSQDHFVNEILPNIRAGKTMMWSICLKQDPTHPIGLIEYSINNNHNNTDQSDRGFWLGEPYWNKGYMSEAITATNDFIFVNLGLEKIILDNFKANIGSRRVKEKTGATFLRTRKEKWRDTEIEIEMWELTAKNWKKFKKGNS
jgi:RimJ/RimL family protein N-acetyltransferase